MALLDVLGVMAQQATNAINAAGITAPGQVFAGWPTAQELMPATNSGGWNVTFFPREGTTRNAARLPFQDLFQVANPASTLVASVIPPSNISSPWTIALSGSVGTGASIAAVVGAPTRAAVYPCAANASLATVAAGLAVAINALGASNVSATVSGNNVLVASSPICLVNVFGVGYVMAREVNRFTCTAQCRVWAPDPGTRDAIERAIESNVGTMAQPFVTLADGTQARCTLEGGHGSGWIDTAQVSYALYVDSLIFDLEYGVLQTFSAYPIQVVEPGLTVGVNASQVIVSIS